MGAKTLYEQCKEEKPTVVQADNLVLSNLSFRITFVLLTFSRNLIHFPLNWLVCDGSKLILGEAQKVLRLMSRSRLRRAGVLAEQVRHKE